MSPFDYHRPGTTTEAVSLINRSADARLIAGGQSLLPTMKLGLAAPADLIDLSGIPELRGIRCEADAIVVGAMTSHAEVASCATVKTHLPALAALANGIGDQQVRARGTLGGSLANNDPAACYPSAALALGASIHTNRRVIAADNFFLGIYQTALEADEIIEAVSFPIPKAAAYIKFRQPASHYALVGVFVARFDKSARVAVTGAAACAFRATDLETALSRDWSAGSARSVGVDPTSLNSDLHASAEYRAHLIPVLAARGVEAAH
jgi:carbon-monoxide dehydrogenase medium subunit